MNISIKRTFKIYLVKQILSPFTGGKNKKLGIRRLEKNIYQKKEDKI